MPTRRVILASVLPALAAAQAPTPPPRDANPLDENSVRLPNGKLQRDEILKYEFGKSLADCKEMVKLARDLQADLEKNEQYVLSIASIHKTEEIEKLARRIRGRMTRS